MSLFKVLSNKPSFAFGPALAIAVFLFTPVSYEAVDGKMVELSAAARLALATTVWMVTWWLTEAVPLAITALLPAVFFPVSGVGNFADLSTYYAHPLIFLFFGGFLIAVAVQKWNLHSWVASLIIYRFAASEPRLLAGFMLATAFLSMWLSNTATAIMMLPIALSVIAHHRKVEGRQKIGKFDRNLLLGVAYSASIGGSLTLVGSPPNLFVVSFLENSLDVSISFAKWFLFALPAALVLLPFTWWILSRNLESADSWKFTSIHRASCGRFIDLPRGAQKVAFVFLATALFWALRPFLNDVRVGSHYPFAFITDMAIALCGGLSMFFLSDRRGGSRLLSLSNTRAVPYGTLILFGGGLALGGGLQNTGADSFIVSQLGFLQDAGTLFVLLGVVALVVFLTELTSNTATTAILAPVLLVTATIVDVGEVVVLTISALAASCAFMMPVATPPNAIVYGSGMVSMRAMVFRGFVLNVASVCVLTGVAYWWLPLFND